MLSCCLAHCRLLPPALSEGSSQVARCVPPQPGSATGDGPLVKRSCLIFLAHSLLVPTPCNDTGVNRAPGTIIIGAERREAPGGAAAADRSAAQSVPGEEPLGRLVSEEPPGSRPSPSACLTASPLGFLPRRPPRHSPVRGEMLGSYWVEWLGVSDGDG